MELLIVTLGMNNICSIIVPVDNALTTLYASLSENSSRFKV